MVFDAHTHLGPTVPWMPKSEFNVTVEQFLAYLKKDKIQKAVAFPNPQVGDYSKANDFIATAMKKHSGIVGFGRVDPRTGKQAVHEIERCYSIGLEGIKLHPYIEFFYPSHSAFFPLYEKCLDLRLPIEFHSDKPSMVVGSAGSFAGLLKEFPKLTVLFGHLQDIQYARFAKQYKNVFVVTSLAPSPEMIEASVKIAGENKVLFGSDWPYMNPRFELAKIELANISKPAKKKILQTNLKKILKF